MMGWGWMRQCLAEGAMVEASTSTSGKLNFYLFLFFFFLFFFTFLPFFRFPFCSFFPPPFNSLHPKETCRRVALFDGYLLATALYFTTGGFKPISSTYYRLIIFKLVDRCKV